MKKLLKLVREKKSLPKSRRKEKSRSKGNEGSSRGALKKNVFPRSSQKIQKTPRFSPSAREATASAPGKILWIGGYSVLEKGYCSLVTAVDKRVFAVARAYKQIILSSPQYGFQVPASFDRQTGKLVLGQDVPAAKFVAKGVEIALSYLSAKKVSLKKIFLETRGDEAFGVGGGKSGLGSSAAATSACVACVLAFHGVHPSPKLVNNLSQIAHSLAQGKVGSGFDVAAACFGSISYSRYSPELVSSLGSSPSPWQIARLADSEWDYSVEKISLPPEMRVVFTNVEGTSASTTEMVKKVFGWKKAHPLQYASLVEELDGANQRAIICLKKRDWTGFQNNFFRGRALTKKLGFLSGAQVEPPLLSELVDDSLRNGAFVCKLPGAGGGDSVAALCLSEFGEKKLKQFWSNYPRVRLRTINLKPSAEGVRVGDKAVF